MAEKGRSDKLEVARITGVQGIRAAMARLADDEAEGAVAPVVGRSWAPLAPGVASAAGGGFEAKGFLVNVEKAEVA